jgi:hypothetical protein
MGVGAVEEVGAVGVVFEEGNGLGGDTISERGVVGDEFEDRRGVWGIWRARFGRGGVGIGAIFGML